jgi:hypothetical protein
MPRRTVFRTLIEDYVYPSTTWLLARSKRSKPSLPTWRDDGYGNFRLQAPPSPDPFSEEAILTRWIEVLRRIEDGEVVDIDDEVAEDVGTIRLYLVEELARVRA